jgi:hypothetical protein
MKKLAYVFCVIVIAISAVFFNFSAFAQEPDWQTNFGGSGNDYAAFNKKTSDGGYIVAGYSSSTDVIPNHGGTDFFVVKTDGQGNMIWQKSFGGSDDEWLTGGVVLSDGYIFLGSTSSNDGDVFGNNGMTDVWIIKIDLNGNFVWQKTFGGSQEDWGNAIVQTFDADGSVNGFIIAASSMSSDHDVTGNYGGYDYWIANLDLSGNLLWQKNFGGSDEDWATSVVQVFNLTNNLPDGFLIAGNSYSEDCDVVSCTGSSDCWLVKISQTGNLEWQKCLGSQFDENISVVKQTSDGGFILVGSSEIHVDSVSCNSDCWVIKLNSTGDLEWEKYIGGSDFDFGVSVEEKHDKYIIIMNSWSADSGFSNNGLADVVTIKLDKSGNIENQKSFGGAGIDCITSSDLETNGDLTLSGYSNSSDLNTSNYHGCYDYIFIKYSEPINMVYFLDDDINVFPNPASSDQEVFVEIQFREAEKVELMDQYGKFVAVSYRKEGNRIVLDLSKGIKPGMYFLLIKTTSKFQYRKKVFID